MSQTGFPNPRQAAGSGSEHSPSFPLISHNKYRAPWCQLTKAQFSECFTHSRLKTPALVGLICWVRSACSLAVHPLGCEQQPQPAGRVWSTTGTSYQGSKHTVQEGRRSLGKSWEGSSRCQGTERGEQTAAAIKTPPAPMSIPLQVSRITSGLYYSVVPHAHLSSTLVSVGLVH